MQIGFVGLGRMGGNMVHRILRDSDHEVVAFDPSAEAVSAASSPASRILRRAAGLALIAAAAAARPAASISLLIAALASLSTVSLLDDDSEPPLRADLAMDSSPSVGAKDTLRL